MNDVIKCPICFQKHPRGWSCPPDAAARTPEQIESGFLGRIHDKKKTAPDGSGGGPLLTADQILSYQTRLQTALREIRSVAAQTPGEWSRRVWSLADDALASTPASSRKTGNSSPVRTETPRHLPRQRLQEEESTSQSATPERPDDEPPERP